MSSEKFERLNQGKPEWSLMDFKSIEPCVRVMEFGAKKYKRDNWKNEAENPTSILDSAMRHLIAMMSGELIDPESKLPHSGHVIANMMMFEYQLRTYSKNGNSEG